jgi:hypothetical protein
MLDDGTLREAYEASEPTAPHVSEDCWERLACGELSLEERDRALDHASGCFECGRILRALLLLEREARAIDPLVPAGLSTFSERRRRRTFLWGAAAAAAAGAILWVTVPSYLPQFPESSSPHGEALRSTGEWDRPVPRSPLAEVAGAPERFTWQGIATGRGYEVELLDADAESLWKSGVVSDESVPWPEEVPPEPGRYYWRVVAILAERGERIASPLVSFDLRP